MKAVTTAIPAFLVSLAFGLDAPFTVKEPGVSSWTSQGIATGIPFAKGQVQSADNLSLSGPSGSMAAQFNPLSRYADGSIMWCLVSFLDNFDRFGVKSYTVKDQAPTAIPSASIQVHRTGSVVEINNGVIRFKIDTVNFTGIDSLFYNGTPVIAGKTGGLSLFSLNTNQQYTNGTVTKAGFEYVGPLYAVYRVQGDFYKAACGGIGYSFMVTTFAGSNKLKLDVSIRNSINAACGNTARVRHSSVSFPLAFTPASEISYKRSASTLPFNRPNLVNLSNGSVSMTVHEDHAGGYYYYAGQFGFHNISRSGGALNVDLVVDQTQPEFDSIPLPGNNKGYEEGDFFTMMDGMHKTSEIFLEFGGQAPSQSELAAIYVRNKSPFIGRPNPEYTISTSAYGIHNRFGTQEDEYRLWLNRGCDTSGVSHSHPARDVDFVFYRFAGAGTHDASEEDPLEQYLLQWIRTGERGYADVAVGFAEFYRNHFSIRSVDFEFDGYGHIDQSLRNKSTRTLEPDGTVPDSRAQRVDIGKWGGCHMAGQGLVDWYCLTGDVDAKEAAQDLAEIAWMQTWQNDGLVTKLTDFRSDFTWNDSLFSGGFIDVSRKQSRSYKMVVSYAGRIAQQDHRWFNRLIYGSKISLTSWNKDPRGFMYEFRMGGFESSDQLDSALWPRRLKDYIAANHITYQTTRLNNLGGFEGHGFNNDEYTYGKKPINGGADTVKWLFRKDDTYWQNRMYAPLDIYYQMTGDEDARDMIIGYAELCGLTPLAIDSCGFSDYTNYDFPDINFSNNSPNTYNPWNPAHDLCRSGFWGTARNSMPLHNHAYALYYPSIMAMGYRYTGDKRILDRAFNVWNRNIKGGHYISYFRAPENKPYYGYLRDGVYNTLGDRLTGGVLLFREAVNRVDTAAPEPINDLDICYAGDKPGTIYMAFTAPADRGGGGIAEYQVKYDTVPIVEYADFNFTADYVFPALGYKKKPWWMGKNLTGESQPAAPGVRQVMTMPDNGLIKGRSYYVAIRTRDREGNLSPLSNVFNLVGQIATEQGGPDRLKMGINASPNPFNPATTFRFSIDRSKPVALRIYDVNGRLIKDFGPMLNSTSGNSGRIVWHGKNTDNRLAGSGIFFARLVNGEKTREIKLILLK